MHANCRFAGGINQGNPPPGSTVLDIIRPGIYDCRRAGGRERRFPRRLPGWDAPPETEVRMRKSRIPDGSPVAGRDREVRILPGKALPRGLPGRCLSGRLHHGRAGRAPLPTIRRAAALIMGSQSPRRRLRRRLPRQVLREGLRQRDDRPSGPHPGGSGGDHPPGPEAGGHARFPGRA